MARGEPHVLSAPPADEHELALRRAAWLKQLYRWHWVSAAISLVGLLMFAITGITLNHAADIGARAEVQTREATLPQPLLVLVGAEQSAQVSGAAPGSSGDGSTSSGDAAVDAEAAEAAGVLPEPVARWLDEELGLRLAGRAAEWSEEEIFVSLPRPGGDAWLRLDRLSGAVEYERSERGWIAWFNDLHRGRHTGSAWSAFIDVFAIACIVFAGSGLLILKMHAGHRPMAWPLIALGAVLPTLILLLFVH